MYNVYCYYFYIKNAGMGQIEPNCNYYKNYFSNCDNCPKFKERDIDNNFALELLRYLGRTY